MGSGSLNAMAVFEASYKEDMTQEEAEALVARAIRSGMYILTLFERDEVRLVGVAPNLLSKMPGTLTGDTIAIKEGSWFENHLMSSLPTCIAQAQMIATSSK